MQIRNPNILHLFIYSLIPPDASLSHSLIHKCFTPSALIFKSTAVRFTGTALALLQQSAFK